ncbi:nucleotidyltransferase [Streptomyces sp. ERV7]|uniref:nucleotidyltransferase domain-containing protein n=1 Tax=Streptomyces sp. ERV7 TaxID=1322334 RepID=UPI0007F36B4A|nr:nucleotidyltransferase domain-containing protein [Streptomyces sp. ERV7]OAR27647.1 nucleotidyltransferase [Streptomyces sp. ERV7]
MDPVEAAHAVVAERHPEARAAFLGGSVLTAHRTAFSDLDIVVLPEEGAAPYREGLRCAGWPVELFVHTEASWSGYVEREIAMRRSPLLFMCATGMLLFDHDGLGAQLQAQAKILVDAGPPALPADELNGRRYALTDLLDDLAGCAQAGERLCLVTEVAQRTGELVLLLDGAWLGGGKWLACRVSATRPGFMERLDAAVRVALAGSSGELTTLVDEVLAPVGGRLWEGHRQDGVWPPRRAAVEGKE